MTSLHLPQTPLTLTLTLANFNACVLMFVVSCKQADVAVQKKMKKEKERRKNNLPMTR